MKLDFKIFIPCVLISLFGSDEAHAQVADTGLSYSLSYIFITILLIIIVLSFLIVVIYRLKKVLNLEKEDVKLNDGMNLYEVVVNYDFEDIDNLLRRRKSQKSTIGKATVNPPASLQKPG